MPGGERSREPGTGPLERDADVPTQTDSPLASTDRGMDPLNKLAVESFQVRANSPGEIKLSQFLHHKSMNETDNCGLESNSRASLPRWELCTVKTLLQSHLYIMRSKQITGLNPKEEFYTVVSTVMFSFKLLFRCVSCIQSATSCPIRTSLLLIPTSRL